MSIVKSAQQIMKKKKFKLLDTDAPMCVKYNKIILLYPVYKIYNFFYIDCLLFAVRASC